MKKFIAVLAVSAIVATAAFAQVSVGGMFGWRGDVMRNNPGNTWSPVHPDSSLPHDVWHWNQSHEGQIRIAASNGEGTAGAAGRFWMNLDNDARLDAWVWWVPMDGLRIQAGRDPWRVLGFAPIVGWGFRANNSEDWLLGWGAAGGYHYGATSRGGRLGRSTGFYDGMYDTGVSMTFQPAGLPLTLVFGLPFPGGVTNSTPGSPERSPVDHWFADLLLNTHLGVRLGFEDLGTLALTAWFAPGHFGWNLSDSPGGSGPRLNYSPLSRDEGLAAIGGGHNATDSTRLYAAFHLTALQAAGIQLSFGLSYVLPFTEVGATTAGDLRTHYPVAAGLGFQFVAGPMRFVARAALTAGGSVGHTNEGWLPDGETVDYPRTRYSIPARFGLNIEPSMAMGGNRLHLNTGFQITAASGQRSAQTASIYDRYQWVTAPGTFTHANTGTTPGPTTFAWHINPYISRTIAGPFRAFAGLHIESSGEVQPASPAVQGQPLRMQRHLVWRIPVGAQFEF